MIKRRRWVVSAAVAVVALIVGLVLMRLADRGPDTTLVDPASLTSTEGATPQRDSQARQVPRAAVAEPRAVATAANRAQRSVAQLIADLRVARANDGNDEAIRLREEIRVRCGEDAGAVGTALVGGLATQAGEPIVSDLLSVLKSCDADAALRSFEAAAASLDSLARIEDPERRRRVAHQLFDVVRSRRTIDSFAPFDDVLDRQEAAYEDLRVQALVSIGFLQGREYVGRLWQVFRADPYPAVRFAAAEALARLGEADVVGQVIDAVLAEPNLERRIELLKTLVYLPDYAFAYDVLRDIAVRSKAIEPSYLIPLYSMLAAYHRNRGAELGLFLLDRINSEPDYEIRSYTLTGLGQLALTLDDESIRSMGLIEKLLERIRRGDMSNYKDRIESGSASLAYLNTERDPERAIGLVRTLLDEDERRAETLLWNLHLPVVREEDLIRREKLRATALDIVRSALDEKRQRDTRMVALVAVRNLDLVELVPDLEKLRDAPTTGAELRTSATTLLAELASGASGTKPRRR